LLVSAIVWQGCDSAGLREAPLVQFSESGNPAWKININRVVDGVFRSYMPRCIDSVDVGDVVEFRNYMPDIPANVTGIAGPAALYSPNLQAPYNFIGEDDSRNTICIEVGEDGSCVRRPQWSFWRTRFDVSGVYDWIDTNSGEPGRKVVDPYYGTVTFVGVDPNTPFGTICVNEADGSGCDSVCCSSDSDCAGDTVCVRSKVDAVGRCLTPSG